MTHGNKSRSEWNLSASPVLSVGRAEPCELLPNSFPSRLSPFLRLCRPPAAARARPAGPGGVIASLGACGILQSPGSALCQLRQTSPFLCLRKRNILLPFPSEHKVLTESQNHRLSWAERDPQGPLKFTPSIVQMLRELCHLLL